MESSFRCVIAGFFYNPCRGLLISPYTAVIISHLSPSCACFLGDSTNVQLFYFCRKWHCSFLIYSLHPPSPFPVIMANPGFIIPSGLSHFNSEAIEPHGSKFQAIFWNFPHETCPVGDAISKYAMSDSQWCCQGGPSTARN